MGDGGKVQYRKFTKSLIFHNFDDALKNPFRYVHLFLLQILLSKEIPKIAMTCNRGSKVAVLHPPLNEGLALIDSAFCPASSTYQTHLNLGQCLEIDDRRSHSIFHDLT